MSRLELKMNYYCVSFDKFSFAEKVLSGKFKLKAFSDFVLPDERLELRDHFAKTSISAKEIILWKAEDLIDTILTALKIEWGHCYSWWDGSCYKYIRTDLSPGNLRSQLNPLLSKLGIRVAAIHTQNAEEDPHKYSRDNFKRLPSIQAYLDYMNQVHYG